MREIFSDIFDGVIARRLGVSTNNLRLLDTLVDLLFYLSLFNYISIRNSSIVKENLILIVSILVLEGFMYAISLIRFRTLPSPHAILSKFWGVVLVIEFSLLLIGVDGNHFAKHSFME